MELSLVYGSLSELFQSILQSVLLGFYQYIVICVFLAFQQPSHLQGTRLKHQWFCCVYCCLPNITNPMYIEQLREMVPPPSQNTVRVCNQITLFIPYHISSRMVTLLKIHDAPTQVCDIHQFQLSDIHFLLFLKCLLVSDLTLFRLSALLWFGSCNHCILACIL